MNREINEMSTIYNYELTCMEIVEEIKQTLPVYLSSHVLCGMDLG